MSSTDPHSYAVLSLGCKVNEVEMETLSAQLKARGFFEGAPSTVSLVFLNTCTVTGEASKKTRKLIRRALRSYPHAQVVATGCAAAMERARLEAIDDRVRVAPKNRLVELATSLAEDSPSAAEPSSCAAAPGAQAIPSSQAASTSPVASSEAPYRMGEGFRTRAGIKIQDGCDNRCSYCIVWKARGASRSMDFDAILDEARVLVDQGVRELVLTGINLGVFRSDQGDLCSLLEALLALGPSHRLRLSSIEPRDVSLSLLELMAASKGRICRHLHIPIQSGSDAVLRAMERDYDRAFILELIGQARSLIPELALSTDVIVAFPGEDEEDFAATLDLVERARFSRVHGFRYSRRPGTKAASRPDQLPAPVAAERARRLELLAKRLRQEDLRQRMGTVEDVLIERPGIGMTESYRRLHFTDEPWELGSLVTLRLPSQEQEGEFRL